MNPSVIVLLVSFFFFLIIGLPVTWTLLLSALASLTVMGGIPITFYAQRLFSGTEKYTLLAIFFFILAGAIMQHGGISRRLVEFCKALLGRIHGSLSIITIVVCMFFAALSGSSIATTAAIGAMLFPELVREGYPEHYAGTLPVVGGTLGIVIPPSIVFVIYGSTTNTSISKLLISGIVPGIIGGLLMCIYAYIYARRHKLPRSEEPFSWKKLGIETRRALWSLMMPVIVLGGIYAGVFTPTEAAAVSVVYGLFVAWLVNKEMGMKKLMRICVDSIKSTANTLLLVSSALVFSWVISRHNIPQMFQAFITSFIHTKTAFLWMSFFVMLFLGMLMDNGPIILIVSPLLYPIAMSYGIDPVQYGCMTVFNLAVGQATPPFGNCLFIGSTVTRQGVMDLAKSAVPFLICLFSAVLLTTFVPWVSLCLVNLMK